MRYLRIFLLLTVSLVLSAQASPVGAMQPPPPDTSTQQKTDEETPEEAFHSIMAETFHSMEQGDLNPIKTRAREFAQKAKAWTDDEAKKGRITQETQPLFARLVDRSKALAETVDQCESDGQIERELTLLHDLMHEIMEKLQK